MHHRLRIQLMPWGGRAYFTHATESPWPLHFKHSHWWKRWSRSNSASRYAWGTNGACECKVDVNPTWFSTWHQKDRVSRSLGLFPKNHLLEVGLTQSKETIAFQMLTIVNLCYFIMCEDAGEIEIHWNSIWLRTWSHMTSHYTWRSMTTWHDFGSVLGWPLDTLFWALTMSLFTALGSCVKWP